MNFGTFFTLSALFWIIVFGLLAVGLIVVAHKRGYDKAAAAAAKAAIDADLQGAQTKLADKLTGK